MEELIEKAKQGDRNAFVEAISLIENDLFNIAFIKLENIEDINDTIQETILKAFENLYRLKEIQYFKTWIIKILINECNRNYRKKYKEKYVITRLSTEGINEDISIETTNKKMDYGRFINELNQKEQDIILLYFYNGFSQKEIGKILKMNVNTVKTKLRRAEEKLKKMRKEDENG